MQERMTTLGVSAQWIVLWVGCLTLPVSILSGTVSHAQSTDADELDETVTLAQTEMSVEQALEAVSTGTGLDIAYGDHLVSPDRRVEFSERQAAARTLLREILEGTDVGWQQWIAGQVVLVRQADSGSTSIQQEGVIEGTVRDRRTGERLPGVNVVVQSLTIGDATSQDGTYRIDEVPAGEHTVSARFVGYRTSTKTVTVPEGETVPLNFSLRRSNMEMDEVVVTGGGENAQLKEIGNSLAQIDEASIDETVSSFGDVIQGQAAGISVLSNSGQSGAGSTIRLRGNSSITQGNSPLIYIDGFRVQNQPVGNDIEVNQTANVLDDINPSDIQNIEIIKGPAATTLYGTEASNGVIEIATKQGSEGDTRVNFSSSQGLSFLPQIGTQDIHGELNINDCEGREGCPEDGDWSDSGHTHEYNLSAQGGSGPVTYFLSGKWGRSSGAFDAAQSNENLSVRGNFGFNVSEDMNVKFNSTYSRRQITWIPDGNNADGLLLNSIRGDEGYVTDVSRVLELGVKTETDHFTGGVTINWSPLSNLNQTVTVGLDYSLSEYFEDRPFGYVRKPEGDRENQTETNIENSFDYSGTLELDLSESISSSTTWGGQLFRDVFNTLEVLGEGFSGVGNKTVTSGSRTEVRDEDRIVEYTGGGFVQERLGWEDRLFLTLGLRLDGSSTFGSNFETAAYPKVSAAYSISEEGFWPEWWDTMKLRGAYGESGRLPGPFDARRTFNPVSGDNGQPGLSPGNPGNPDLGPERSREIEVGADFSGFGGRVSGSFTWFRQRTDDAILNIQEAPSSGFRLSRPDNAGTLESRGVEAELDVGVIERENVSWSVGGTYSTNDTEVIDLEGVEEVEFTWDQGVREGTSIPTFFGNVLENPDQIPEDPQNVQYKDERQPLGSTFPTQQMSVNTSVTWKNLTVQARGDGSFGHVLSAGTARENAERGVWPGCSDIVDQISEGNYDGLTARQLGRCDPSQIRDGQWVFSGDFFRLRSASIQYRIPDGLLPTSVRQLNLRLQARNLVVLTDFPGLDPEAFEDGSANAPYRQEYYNLPPTKSITFTLDASF